MKRNEDGKVIYLSFEEEVEKFEQKEAERCKGLKWLSKDFFEKFICSQIINKKLFWVVLTILFLIFMSFQKANATETEGIYADHELLAKVRAEVSNVIVPNNPILCDGTVSKLTKSEYQLVKNEFEKERQWLNQPMKIEIIYKVFVTKILDNTHLDKTTNKRYLCTNKGKNNVVKKQI